jgi:bacillithiol biosynthesis deacetylase BshB1
MKPEIDFLVFAAHADDAELGAGGTIAKMTHQGKRGVLVDLCDASAASRGTVDSRRSEADLAAQILGVPERINLGFPDAHLMFKEEYLRELVRIIRLYRPKILMTHYQDDNHPDHYHTAALVKEAWYKSGLQSLWPELPAHRPRRLFHFMGPVLFQPVFCVDISAYFDIKWNAILAYKSQFWHKDIDLKDPITSISTPEFLDFVKTRNRFYGSSIRRQYAEPFWCREYAEAPDLLSLGMEAY